MDNVLKKILELKAEKNISDSQFIKDLHFYNSIVSEWKNGSSKSYTKHLPKIADYFDVTVDHLLGHSETPKLPPNMFPLTDSTAAMIPIVATVRGGWNGVPEPVYDGTMAVYDRKNPHEYVWMKVEGDSMSPNIMDGDYVLVHIQPTAENGDVVVAIWNGEEGTVKKYQRDENGVMLIPLNTQYPARFISNDQLDQFLIYGVVKESKRKWG